MKNLTQCFRMLSWLLWLFITIQLTTEDFLRKIEGENWQPAERGQFPYVVQVLHGDDLRCSGILYNASTIITAAHCAIDATFVEAGNSNFRGETIRSREQNGDVVKRFRHPKFRPKLRDTYIHDIGIIILEKPFKEDKSFIKYLRLSYQQPKRLITKYVIIGFDMDQQWFRKVKPVNDEVVEITESEIIDNKNPSSGSAITHYDIQNGRYAFGILCHYAADFSRYIWVPFHENIEFLQSHGIEFIHYKHELTKQEWLQQHPNARFTLNL